MSVYSLNSNKIEVFPTSISRSMFPYARVLTEDHILDLIRSVAPSDSFVLTPVFNMVTPFEFIIHGYYVKIDASSSSPHSFTGDNVYAHIFIDTTSSTHPQLRGKDDTKDGDQSYTFTGVLFSDTETPPESVANSEHYKLHILKKVGSSYTIPLTSTRCLDGGEFE